MKKSSYFAISILIVVSAIQYGVSQDKKTNREVNVKVNYTGSGVVDDKHPIRVILFDSRTLSTVVRRR